MSEQRIEEARQLHRSGQLANAIAAYQQVLAADPQRAEVWHLKGMAEHQAGQLEAARESAARAIAVGGERPAFLLLEGGVLHDRGELAAAGERFARLVASKPDWPQGHIELGLVRMDQGRPDIALENFRAAVGLDPKLVRGWNNLGVALQALDRLDEAVRAFNHTLTLDPRFAMAHFNLARIHNLRGDPKRALEHAQAAVRNDARLMDAWLLLGDIHRRNREWEPALSAYAMAARAAPGNVKALSAHTELLAEIGRYEEARTQYRQIATGSPGNLKAALGANLLLPQHYRSVDHLEGIRREYGEGLERLGANAGAFRFPSSERALADARWTNFYLAYQGRNDRELQSRYGDFQHRVLAAAAPEFFELRRRRPGRERIRVGFLSHFFFNCTAGRYFASWVTRLDRSRFETFVYYTNDWVADDTRTIAAAASTFRHLPGRPLHTLARHVLADELDILVYPELGMHPDNFTLAALRLAPVQCSGWGHPNTTGLPEIDWYISAGDMEPADAPSHYRERLALLPGLGTHYATPATNEKGTRADFGIPAGSTAYLVPQSLFKIHPDNDELIAQVLERDPRGVAVMFASNHDVLTQAFADRLGARLKLRGMDINDRVIFIGTGIAHPTYLRLNQMCDVMLDTLHWSGGNTSLDALSMGLPVVTLPGALMRGRQSQAMLRILGVEELIARDVPDYVSKAEMLGKDPVRRRALRETIL
ncbi:MAG TPA: tetratricopeptide repeat protein, partial [Usitatibacter sp.]|nr:tetratricopeptide repeat protein [Usitatibacter sp.]